MKRLYRLSLLLCLLLSNCKSNPKPVESCGDGVVDPGEECDGANLGGATCESLGHYARNGKLACLPNCTFDRSDCGGRCGDGVIQTDVGEVCDGTDLNDATCVGLGYYGGTISCAADCRAFDESDCARMGRCGDGAVQSGYGEVCDGNNLDGQSCTSLGYYGGTLACQENCRGLAPCLKVNRLVSRTKVRSSAL